MLARLKTRTGLVKVPSGLITAPEEIRSKDTARNRFKSGLVMFHGEAGSCSMGSSFKLPVPIFNMWLRVKAL
jgi:hypothetical protein